MGLETSAIIGLALAAAGAGTTAIEQNRVENRQEDIATKRLVRQQQKQREANNTIDSALAKIKGSTGDAEREQANAGFIDALRRNAAAVNGSGPRVGGSRFGAESAASDAAVQNYGTARAGQMARLAAPGRQRMNENLIAARMASDVGGIARDANAEDQILQDRAMAIRANPWVMAAGQFAQAAGGAYGARAAGAVSDSDLLTSQAMSDARVNSVLGDLSRKASAFGR